MNDARCTNPNVRWPVVMVLWLLIGSAMGLLVACYDSLSGDEVPKARCNPACEDGQQCIFIKNGSDTACSIASRSTPPQLNEPGDEQPLSCEQILFCEDDCVDHDKACIEDCYEKGTSAGQKYYDQLSQCYNNHCLTAENQEIIGQCMNTHCPEATARCMPVLQSQADAPSAQQKLTCSELLRCQSHCVKDDESCLDDCDFHATATASQEYETLIQCERDFCADIQAGDALDSCMTQWCADEWTQCFGTQDSRPPELGGSLTCSQIIECKNNCSATDSDCLTLCQSWGSYEGQQNYEDFATCFNQSCAKARNDYEMLVCMTTSCAGPLNACYGRFN